MSLQPSDLEKYGITFVQQIFYNPSYEELFEHETNPDLEGYERGFVTELDTVTVDTGIFTGRSPNDKYIVREPSSEENIWWKSAENPQGNIGISQEVWEHMRGLAQGQLSGKKLYVVDGYCGANEKTRLKIRVITEIAWQAHFAKNMFIRPAEEELTDFEPEYIMLNACKVVNDKWEEQGLTSENFVAFHLAEKMAVIGGTWYGGEMKKGFFSIMNYLLPLRGIAAMHCSANVGQDGDTAIFFGLSGTGKTTLSTDPKRLLIGDDEHGWDDEGVFNFEGGCYAKCIELSPEKEPDIYKAIKRNALLENVEYDAETGKVDFDSAKKTQNTRVSYPIYHIENIVQPVSKAGHARNILFLSADAFGVLPPVAKLTKEQAMYYFLSGYTAKVAGTERGVTEPKPTFSAAFGAPFLMLHPTKYATELRKKIDEHSAHVWLVNTGWVGGAYGVGKRIDLKSTRAIVDAILNGSLVDVEYEELPIFNLQIPKEVPHVDTALLNPRNQWADTQAYDAQAQMLAGKFIANFEQYTNEQEGVTMALAGPKL